MDANTVVYPGTVVIESLDAHVTDAAVSRPICSDTLAIWAKEHWIEFFQHFHKAHLLGLLDVTWIFAHCNQMKNKGEAKQA